MTDDEIIDKIHDIAEEVILDIDERINKKNIKIENKLDKLLEILKNK